MTAMGEKVPESSRAGPWEGFADFLMPMVAELDLGRLIACRLRLGLRLGLGLGLGAWPSRGHWWPADA